MTTLWSRKAREVIGGLGVVALGCAPLASEEPLEFEREPQEKANSSPNSVPSTTSLAAENGSTITGIAGGGKVLFQEANQKVCWNNVNVAGVTGAVVRYATGETDGATLQLSRGPSATSQTALGAAIVTTHTPAPGWVLEHMKNARVSFPCLNGTTTLCIRAKANAGGWVASLEKVILTRRPSSTGLGSRPVSGHVASGTVLWRDEFDGKCALGGPLDQNGLCKNHWRYNHEAHFNNEWQEYVTEGEAKALGVVKRVNGVLQINARNIDGWWWSARLITKDRVEFKQGRLEARLRLPTWPNPQRQGPWPAFWLLGHDINELPAAGVKGWQRAGAEEIDIFEAVVNQGSHRIDANIIADDDCAGGDPIAPCPYPWPYRLHWIGWPKAAPVVNFADWHTYALEWKAKRLEVFQDGVSFGSVDPTSVGAGPVFQQNMYILFNLAIGGTLGGDATGLPDQTLEVDWIRHTSL